MSNAASKVVQCIGTDVPPVDPENGKQFPYWTLERPVAPLFPRGQTGAYPDTYGIDWLSAPYCSENHTCQENGNLPPPFAWWKMD